MCVGEGAGIYKVFSTDQYLAAKEYYMLIMSVKENFDRNRW